MFLRRRRPLRAFAVAAWLLEGCLHKLVLVVASVASREPLERWVFNVQREDDAESGEAARCGARWLLSAAAAHWLGSSDASKGRSDVSAQIAAIIRQVRRSHSFLVKASYDKTFPAQITASVTFLPLLDEPCASCAGAGSCSCNLRVRRCFRPARVHRRCIGRAVRVVRASADTTGRSD